MRFPTLIYLLILYFSSTYAQSTEGDSCNLKDGTTGQCKLLLNCPFIYAEFKAGKFPTNICGWSGFDPLVCCPPSTNVLSPKTTERPITARPKPTPSPTTSSRPPTRMTTDSSNNQRHESISRRMCYEYSRAVYTLVYPPILTFEVKPVNTSLCAFVSKKLIVGGTQADSREFPHMAAIGFNVNATDIGWLCGGTIVSDKYVLTAAHCLYSIDYGEPQWVRVGDLNLKRTDDDASPVTHKIMNSIYHPDYKSPAEYHDIGLLLVEKRIEFNAWVRPACLPSLEQLQQLNGNEPKVLATGWGNVEWEGERSDDLLKVVLPIVKHSICKTSYPAGGLYYKLPNGIVDDWQICAGSEQKDTCQGDSGGPVVIYDSQYYCMYDVIGVTSLGSVCGSTAPGVYTRVYKYIPWLESIIWPSN